MHSLTDINAGLLVVGETGPVLRSLVESGSTFLGVSLGLCIVLWVEKVGVGKSPILEETSGLDLLVAIRAWDECSALARNLDLSGVELADGKSSGMDGLDMVDEVAVGDVN